MSSQLPLTMDRGDHKTWEFTVTLDEVALDITDAVFRFMAKTNVNDDDNIAVVTATTANGKCAITVALTGKMEVRLAPTDTSAIAATKRLYYDLQMEQAGGQVRTVARGLLTVEADVSITVP